jgi:beta-glucanase (GH16 family)
MPPPADSVPPGYRLVWAEEFNEDGRPDPANWDYERGFRRNEEDQWYQEENAFVQDGHLMIEGRREPAPRPNPDYVAGSDDWRTKRPDIYYTAASINTRGKHEWTYGRFEMRGKIPVGEGFWPAWWTLGVNGDWPAGGEIDMMEYYDGKLLANVACLGPDGSPEWFIETVPVTELGGAAWAGQFHVWRMDWDAEAIALYLDDRLLNRVPLDRLVNKDGSGHNPFREPHYLLLNLALGGRNGGSLADTPLPARMLVDYVRVYQRE